MATQTTQVQVKKDVGTQIIERINSLCETGFVLPKDYSYVNAIKASLLDLQAAKTRDGKPVLEACTPISIQSALFKMASSGLDVSKRQGYFIPYGNELTFVPSYFGHILQVKRLFPDWQPVANTVREGDDFVFTIDPHSGKKILVKHETKLENLDNELMGGYLILPNGELYVMTKKQILNAWSKSANKSLTTHKLFDEKMAIKSIINSGCEKVINGTPAQNVIPEDEESREIDTTITTNVQDFDEAEDVTNNEPTQKAMQPQAESTQNIMQPQSAEATPAAVTNNDDEF